MFLQLVCDRKSAAFTQANAFNLTQYHPLLITALAETVWRNRYTGQNWMPFEAWPAQMTERIFSEFSGGSTNPPGLLNGSTNWDHLIYAYLVESTRIYEVFRKVLEMYQTSDRLETPSPQGQRFWRNTEYLIYSDQAPTTVWNTTSRTRPDEVATRMEAYWWAFGLDLPPSRDLARRPPYNKPSVGKRQFAETLEPLLREVWVGKKNFNNIGGERLTDEQAILMHARRMYDMMISWRLNGNLCREEFRAVSVMSWLHLAVMWDSPAVIDLKAQAPSPEERLRKIAGRVGMTIHEQSKALFDLAQPLSLLLQWIEAGAFLDLAGARTLYQTNTIVSDTAQIVIDNYNAATGRDVKAPAVAITERRGVNPPGTQRMLPSQRVPLQQMN